VTLNIPLYANDLALDRLGSKSGGREVFREAGVQPPKGFEHLRDEGDLILAIASVKRRPELERVVVKLNEGFSGEGNAIFHCEDAPQDGDLLRRVGLSCRDEYASGRAASCA
jgi:hypothetical protein